MAHLVHRSFLNSLLCLTIIVFLPAEIDAGSCHDPQPWLLDGGKVVIAMASEVICLHVDAVFLGIPHQLAIHLGIWMIAIHALLPTY